MSEPTTPAVDPASSTDSDTTVHLRCIYNSWGKLQGIVRVNTPPEVTLIPDGSRPTPIPAATATATGGNSSQQEGQPNEKSWVCSCIKALWYSIAMLIACSPTFLIPILATIVSKYASGASVDTAPGGDDPSALGYRMWVLSFVALVPIGTTFLFARPMKIRHLTVLDTCCFRFGGLVLECFVYQSILMLSLNAMSVSRLGVGKAINKAPMYHAECGRHLSSAGDDSVAETRYAVEFHKSFMNLWSLGKLKMVTYEAMLEVCPSSSYCYNVLTNISRISVVMHLDISNADTTQLATLTKWCGAEYVAAKPGNQAAIITRNYTTARERFDNIVKGGASAKLKYPLLRKTRYFPTTIDGEDPAKMQKLVNERTILFMDTDEATPLDLDDQEGKITTFMVVMWVFYPFTLPYLAFWMCLTTFILKDMCRRRERKANPEEPVA